jgi:hypothetical protein
MASGDAVVWSRAEGRRGTRWRESIHAGDALQRVLLVEVDTDGLVSRLEVATDAGLLTLHPEADASALHGNVVTPSGILHLAFEWDARMVLVVVDSPVLAGITIGRHGMALETGSSVHLPGIVIGDDLTPITTDWRLARLAVDRWRMTRGSEADGRSLEVGVDAVGDPVLVGAQTWPLER